MEQKTGVFNSLGGILRLLLGLLIVAIVAFLLIRFISGRNAVDDAQKAAQPAISEQKSSSDTSSGEIKSSGDSKSDSSTNSSSNSTSAELPSGIADIKQSSAQNVPATGAGDEVIYTTIVSAFVTFGLFELFQLVKKRSHK